MRLIRAHYVFCKFAYIWLITCKFRLHIFGHNFCHVSNLDFKTAGLVEVMSKLCYAPYIVCVECLTSES